MTTEIWTMPPSLRCKASLLMRLLEEKLQPPLLFPTQCTVCEYPPWEHAGHCRIRQWQHQNRCFPDGVRSFVFMAGGNVLVWLCVAWFRKCTFPLWICICIWFHEGSKSSDKEIPLTLYCPVSGRSLIGSLWWLVHLPGSIFRGLWISKLVWKFFSSPSIHTSAGTILEGVTKPSFSSSSFRPTSRHYNFE